MTSHAPVDRLVYQLQELIRIPSVSSDPRRAADVRRCAAWLAAHLRRTGLDDVALLRTPGHPIVWAAWRHRRDRPTLLLYGHYDVQAPGDRSSWRTPPFEPTLEGEYLLGRGAADDKGPLFAHLAAIGRQLERTGALPLNVICVLEGEEEVGSPHLIALLADRPDLLAADAAVISDTRMLGPNRPTITTALRGQLSLELAVRGPGRPLHAGYVGGAVQGAAGALVEVLAQLHDDDGRVAVSGFYDRVRDVQRSQRRELARGGAADHELLASIGRRPSVGEPGFSAYERTTVRPALSTTALSSGRVAGDHVGAIPTEARARLDVRLVADQNPSEIVQRIRSYVERLAPPGVDVTLRTLGLAPPVVLSSHHAVMDAAVAACRTGFGAAPTFVRSGGTIPIVGHLQRRLGIPVVLLGLSLPDDRRHGPNERLHLPTFRRGVTTAEALLGEVAERLRR